MIFSLFTLMVKLPPKCCGCVYEFTNCVTQRGAIIHFKCKLEKGIPTVANQVAANHWSGIPHFTLCLMGDISATNSSCDAALEILSLPVI